MQCREGEYSPLAEDAKYGDDEAGETNDDEQAGAEEEEEEEEMMMKLITVRLFQSYY